MVNSWNLRRKEGGGNWKRSLSLRVGGDSAVRERLLLVLWLVLPTAGDERQRPVRDSARVRSTLPPKAVKTRSR
jgi:hypothetical protein